MLLGDTMAGVALLDTRLRYLYVNPALERLNGIPAAAHLGRTISEVLPGIDAKESLLREVLEGGQPREVTTSGQTPASSGPETRYWHGVYHRLERDGRVWGLLGIVLEVSADVHQQERLEQARRHLTLLDTASTSIGTTLDLDTTCRELAEFVVPDLADAASVEIFPPEVGHSVRPAPTGVVRLRRAGMAAVPRLREAVKRFGRPGQYVDYQEGGAIPRCLATGRPVLINMYSDEQISVSAPNPERVADYRALGFHSSCVVPLTARGRPLGSLTLVRADGSPEFTDDDVVVARELAGRAAIDLDHARRYARERGIALELQRSLLSEPHEPHPHVEVATRYLASGPGAMVGGDWFDVLPLSDARHLKVMGDVMGHGVEAAVAMSHYRSMLRVLAVDDLSPHVILEQLDRMVERSGFDRAATCLLAVVDRFRGTCDVASAGHLPPVLIGPATGARLAEIPVGPPLGTGLGGYEVTTLPCPPGSVLFLYTDGLVERRGEDIDVSLGRLTGLTLPAGGGLEDLLDEVLDRFGRHAEDDIAVLASRIRQPGRPAPTGPPGTEAGLRPAEDDLLRRGSRPGTSSAASRAPRSARSADPG
ncbi:SpoIIE family protein phosphatase [Streptomyces sp. NPDC051322]|uniref:SpoIIE family protein phosphatase n=1 Tax=Streptomyces sp. NPDC051322 TaxID=3154645 RepID=UPI00344FBE36